MSQKILIQKKVLEKLYWKDNMSPVKIGRLYNCTAMTIRSRMLELDVSLRSLSQARMRYKKYNFSGDLIEKAYLIGFRLGDLNVYQKSTSSEIIVARCNTTQLVQVELMKKIFSKYGKVTASKGEYSINVNCFLDQTFAFLLPDDKRVPGWVENDTRTINAFIAGYTDAEGNFILNQQRARFKIDAYDVEIISSISNFLTKRDIIVKMRCIAKKGQVRTDGMIFNNDLWRININEAFSLLKFIDSIRPYIKHKKRSRDMIICKKNIEDRIRKGTIKYE